MAKPGTIPESRNPQLEEAFAKAAAEARVAAMSGDSGELPGGVQGYVDEEGVTHFAGKSQLEPVYSDVGTPPASATAVMQRDMDLRRAAALQAAREKRQQYMLEEQRAADSDFRRAADFAESRRVARLGVGYAAGGASHSPSGGYVDPETGAAYEYNDSLGATVAKQPKEFLTFVPEEYQDLPFNYYMDADGYGDGFEYYYTDEEGNPNKDVISLQGWSRPPSDGAEEVNNRILETLAALDSSEYLDADQVASIRAYLEGSAE